MWNKLSMKEKAALIKVAVSNGLTDLDLIKNKYNEFADGGSTKSSDKEYYSYMEKLATKKAKDWGEDPDITLTHMLNSNDYNYRVFYDNNIKKALAMLNADPEAHFTDVGKTVYHPTFSNESIYSGKKSDYNPRGTIGGSWNGLEYVPSKSQLENKDFNYNKTKKYLTNTPEYIDSKYNFKALGGPLLNQNNPIESFNGGRRLPVVRYDDGGPIRNSKDKNRWLGTVFENYIIEAENPDSIGWDPKTKMWTTPTISGYDKNQVGIGNDIQPKNNEIIQPYLIHNADGTKSISEKNERTARYNKLDETEISWEKRLSYANEVVNKGNKPVTPSDIKKAITMSAIYNQGRSYVANNHFEDKNLMNALIHGTDEEYLEQVLKYYNDKDRVRREREFFNNYKKSQEKNSIIDRLMSLFD